MLAIFDNLGFSELMIVMVAAILIFGKRLPEVASQAGAQIAKFRRSLQDIKNDTGIDNDIRKIQREIQQAVPRDLSMGEMARIASIELEKRMKANDEPKTETAKSPDVADTTGVVTKPAGSPSASPAASGESAHASRSDSARAPSADIGRIAQPNAAHSAEPEHLGQSSTEHTSSADLARAAQPSSEHAAGSEHARGDKSSDVAADTGAHP